MHDRIVTPTVPPPCCSPPIVSASAYSPFKATLQLFLGATRLARRREMFGAHCDVKWLACGHITRDRCAKTRVLTLSFFPKSDSSVVHGMLRTRWGGGRVFGTIRGLPAGVPVFDLRPGGSLQGTAGRMISVVIMVCGVTLFLNLARTLFQPRKVFFQCPDCGLQRHHYDAVHCKACGVVINIPNDEKL